MKKSENQNYTVDNVYSNDGKIIVETITFQNVDFSKIEESDRKLPFDVCNLIAFDNCSNLNFFEFPETVSVSFHNTIIPEKLPQNVLVFNNQD